MSYSASDLRKGLKIELEGVPFEVVEFQFVKPGKGQAMYKCRLKNILSEAVFDRTFRAVDHIDTPNLEEHELAFSYPEGDHYIFIDNRSFEQHILAEDVVGEKRHFLEPELVVNVLYHNGRPIQLNLPSYVDKRIFHTEPGARGDTATNVTKLAKLEDGYEIQVPLFINEGDVVRIDTRTGKYRERVSVG